MSSEEEEEEEEEDGEDDVPVLIVKASMIPNAGQGLFLASRFVPAGAVLIEEEAIAIKRREAKKITNMPAWRNRQPVIQGGGNRFLDIRLLTIYKANHCEATSPNCNACVSQSGPARLTMTALRNIWRHEEILWEYSPTMQEFSS